MIPKKIHYCWFGGKPLTPMAEECIASWREKMPDYEIVEWNESNFDFSSCEFALKAYENKKWAFVSDYCRTWVLYNHGGIYLDTDVKAIKSYNPFLNDKCFIGFEEIDLLEADTIGCEKGHPFMRAVLDSFEKTEFRLDKGIGSVGTMPQRVTRVFLEKYRVKRFYDRKIVLPDVKVYPTSYFSPIEYLTGKKKITRDTVSVHLYNGSWLNEKHKPVNAFKYGMKKAVKKCLYATIGYDAAQKLIHRGNKDV